MYRVPNVKQANRNACQQQRFLDPAHSQFAFAFERRQKPRNRRLTVLVVDDERHIREFLAIGLLSQGFEVKTATDGHEAVEICQDSPIEVALVDNQMPGMSGQETVAAIRQTAPWVRS